MRLPQFLWPLFKEKIFERSNETRIKIDLNLDVLRVLWMAPAWTLVSYCQKT